MKGLFEIAVGSVTGRNHTQTGKNNQDAYYYISNELATIAIVCDGCGSSQHSEVGAKIGARIIAETIAFHLNQDKVTIDELFWQQVQDDVVRKLEEMALCLASFSYLPDEAHKQKQLSVLINDYFLFTIVGVLITKSVTTIFSVGDGVIGINGMIKPIGAKYNNFPSYLAYALCGHPEWVQWEIQGQLSTAEVENILIATDGVNDLMAAEKMNIPGKQEKIGDIAQFWQQDRYFRNPDNIRRRLSLINREVIQPDWQNHHLHRQPGLLADDTTLVVIRKLTI